MKKYKLDSVFGNIRHIDVGPRGIFVSYKDGSHRFVRQVYEEEYRGLKAYARDMMPKPKPPGPEPLSPSSWPW